MYIGVITCIFGTYNIGKQRTRSVTGRRCLSRRKMIAGVNQQLYTLDYIGAIIWILGI